MELETMSKQMKIERVNGIAPVSFEDFIIENDFKIVITKMENHYDSKYLLAQIKGNEIVVRYTPSLLGERTEQQEECLLILLRDKISGKTINGIQVPVLRKC